MGKIQKFNISEISSGSTGPGSNRPGRGAFRATLVDSFIVDEEPVPFESTEQMRTAVRDVRYRTDPHYRRIVERRIIVSDFGPPEQEAFDFGPSGPPVD